MCGVMVTSQMMSDFLRLYNRTGLSQGLVGLKTNAQTENKVHLFAVFSLQPSFLTLPQATVEMFALKCTAVVRFLQRKTQQQHTLPCGVRSFNKSTSTGLYVSDIESK